MITNKQAGTNVHEIAEGIYRISTPIPPSLVPGGFSFNQFLIVNDEGLLYHTGGRQIFPLVQEAISRIIPLTQLKYIGFSHYESDECGSLNDFLALAPQALPLCGSVNAMINSDSFNRPPHILREGEILNLGRHRISWIDTPHLPHAWECGHLFEESTQTLFCGDLFTQGGSDNPALTEKDILGPSEEFRKRMDYFSHTQQVGTLMQKLAAKRPLTLACMHGSSWKGAGADLLLEWGEVLAH